MKIKTYLVDDHQIVLDGLSSVLEDDQDIEVIGTARNGEGIRGLLLNEQPHVLVVDYNLSDDLDGETGYDVATEVLEKYPDVLILFLTMHNSLHVIRPCVEAGAHGYMLKSERGFDIASAIKELWKTGHYFSPDVRKSLTESTKETAVETITEREREIIQALFEGMSTKEMAEKFFISSHTVETHRRNLMGKLEAKNRQHLVYLAIKNGIIAI